MKKNHNKTIPKTPLIRIGEVISVYDETDGDRIKVSIKPDDDGNDIGIDTYAFPLLPKMLHVKPKIGECVLVLTAIATEGESQRFYIGPVISQPNHMTYEPITLASTTLNRGEIKAPEQAQSTIPKAAGAYPKEEDIAIEGRKNADIQITEDDIRLRAGAKLMDVANDYDVSFNRQNPAYVKVQYEPAQQTTPNGTKYQSTTSIVSDKIIMLSNNSKNGYNLTDKDELISNEDMQDIIDRAHLLPYGDILISFLDKLRFALLHHTHPNSMSPPCVDVLTGTKQVQDFDLNTINSDTFRID